MKPEPHPAISRRDFVHTTTAAATAALLAAASADSANAAAPPRAATAEAEIDPHPFLTAAKDFDTVARGNPKPHSLTGKALADARLTADTWRLQITTDPAVDPPHVTRPASVEKQLTLADGSALTLPKLIAMGERHGVKYIKAMQCLNIQTPLGQGLWEGVPLRDVLGLCGKMIDVRRLYYWGFHNNDPGQLFQSSLSYAQAMETPPGELPAFLAYRLNGEPLPLLRGGPVRMIVPWAHGFKSVKWLQHIVLTNDYRANDTYALSNNDPESHLKTAAYVDPGPDKVKAGQPVTLTGQVIVGQSGLKRVEYWARPTPGSAPAPGSDNNNANNKPAPPQRLDDEDPELLRGPWTPCELQGPPNWKVILPAGVATKDLLGFNPDTGQPLTWPPRYGMISYYAVIENLKPGRYEIRARAVDLNGYAQPEPRPIQKSGKNAIQMRSVQVV
jgi:DMSO/TMAO reductase YedYZ molybdopterin-dependent catalytic subunit